MFDSIEFDNGFLSKLDFEEKQINLTNNFCNSNSTVAKIIKNQEIHENSSVLKKSNYYDLSLSVQDISESIIRNNYKHVIEKKICHQDQGKFKEEKKNICLSPLSPIKGSTFCAYKKHLSFSSTPLRDNSNIKNLSVSKKNEGQKAEKNNILKQDFTEYAYIDADLFEDWNDSKLIKNNKIDKSSFTVSQAINFIEKAEEQNENEDCASNNSIDLLTGEIVQCERNTTENLFLSSLNFSNVDFLKHEREKDKMSESSCLQDTTTNNNENLFQSEKKNKSLAAQKLNFGNINSSTLKKSRLENIDIGFESDDSFDAIINFNLSRSFEENDSIFNIKCSKLKLDTNTCKEVEKTKNNGAVDLSDSGCFNRRKKKTKYINVIESDSGDEEYSSNLIRQGIIRNTVKKSLPSKNSDTMFLDLEAEVSEDSDISSDESMEILDEYEKSFIDEKSYLTQNNVEDLTTKYLESIKCIGNRQGFKIPKAKPYFVEDICSQVSPNKSSNYEFDSFCVNDIEFDEHLSDLEVAEQVLEIDRKKSKKNKRKLSRKEKN